jgi:uracil-DNA glycosylase
MRTPRAAARRRASQTIAAVSGPRSKSYWARSSVRFARSRKPAIAVAISGGRWPPSVRVRIVISGFIERLSAAGIGATFNFYREGERAALLRERLAAYLERQAGADVLLVGEAPGYRGTRVSGIPLTSERQLTGSGPGEATATVVHRALEELGVARDVLLWNLVPTHPGDERSNRRPSRSEIEAGKPFALELARGRRIVPVGRLAWDALGGAYVRHPAHGGAAAFREGLRAALL